MNLRIKEVIKEKGMTITELADKMGINRVNLSNMVNGNPTVETLTKIATALNVPISALFEAEKDFIAFVRRNGETFTFDSEKALKEYAATLPVEDK